MRYRVVTKFETLYTKETEVKIEYTTDFKSALNAYIIYIEHPEVVFCTIEQLGPGSSEYVHKIIAAFNVQ